MRTPSCGMGVLARPRLLTGETPVPQEILPVPQEIVRDFFIWKSLISVTTDG
ncbi:hypothetical protein [Scytonema sp. NUACC26]|uniref:hypothetical protein n=1 Tax=Scytonema sp. NUACC26 TaxID=3140176 RepID=UPI0038B39A63